MSEESTPPPLRLKARLRPDGEKTAPPEGNAAQPESPPPSPAEAVVPKLRLKPRLDSAAPAPESPEPNAVPASIDAPSEPPAFQLKPRTAAPLPPADAPAPSASSDAVEHPVLPSAAPLPTAAVPEEATPTDAQKFKFKPKPVEIAPVPEPMAVPPAAKLPAPPPPPLKTKTAPPFPVLVEAAVVPRKIPVPAPVPHFRAVAEADLTASVNPAAAGRSSTKKIVLGAAATIALIAIALGYRWWKTRPAPPPVVAVAHVVPGPKASPAGTLAPALVNATTTIAALPKKLIDDAQNTVQGRRTIEQDRIDALAAGEEPSDKRALNTPPPSTFSPTPAAEKAAAAAPAMATTQLAPGITVTTATDVAGDASPAFRAWVTQLKLNGVFHGSPPRALINGRTYRAGQIVDDALGITFESVDSDAKTIIFRDRSGATASRRY